MLMLSEVTERFAMPTIRLSPVDTSTLPRQRLRPVPRATQWHYRAAVPFIILLSVALWAVVWESAAYTAAVILR